MSKSLLRRQAATLARLNGGDVEEAPGKKHSKNGDDELAKAFARRKQRKRQKRAARIAKTAHRAETRASDIVSALENEARSKNVTRDRTKQNIKVLTFMKRYKRNRAINNAIKAAKAAVLPEENLRRHENERDDIEVESDDGGATRSATKPSSKKPQTQSFMIDDALIARMRKALAAAGGSAEALGMESEEEEADEKEEKRDKKGSFGDDDDDDDDEL